MTYIFAHFSGPQAPVYFPGAAFLAASVCVVAAATAFTILIRKNLHTPEQSVKGQATSA
jgi:DHA1 family tetracycline resistance protein-like MFS transporter